MNPNMFEPMLINATIRTLDNISRKAADAGKRAEGLAGKLLSRWDQLDRPEKEQVIGIVIATATTAVTAIAALRSKSKGTAAKRAKKMAKKIVRKRD